MLIDDRIYELLLLIEVFSQIKSLDALSLCIIINYVLSGPAQKSYVGMY